MAESKNAKDLWNEIVRKRKELGDAYEQEGSTPMVLALSQELDKLLNQFDEIMRNEKNEL